jgi:uncharacterized protein DUF5994
MGNTAERPPGDHGPITHILLRAADWDSRPHRLRVEGVEGLTDTRVVRLSWFDTRPAGLLTVISADGHRVDLLSVLPHTDENAAWAAIEQAAKAGIASGLAKVGRAARGRDRVRGGV